MVQLPKRNKNGKKKLSKKENIQRFLNRHIFARSAAQKKFY